MKRVTFFFPCFVLQYCEGKEGETISNGSSYVATAKNVIVEKIDIIAFQKVEITFINGTKAIYFNVPFVYDEVEEKTRLNLPF